MKGMKYYGIVMAALPISLAWALYAPHTTNDWLFWLGELPLLLTQFVFLVKFFEAQREPEE